MCGITNWSESDLNTSHIYYFVSRVQGHEGAMTTLQDQCHDCKSIEEEFLWTSCIFIEVC